MSDVLPVKNNNVVQLQEYGVYKNLQETSVILQLPQGNHKGLLSWKNYKPTVFLDILGSLIPMKVHIDTKALTNAILTDQLAEQGVTIEPLELEKAQFSTTTVSSTVTIRSFIPEYPYNYTLIKGHVQSGKTSFIIAQAISAYCQGVVALIVLRNLNSDLYQLKSRIREKISQVNDTVNKQIINPTDVCDLKGGLKNLKKGYRPLIIVSLANNSQLEKFQEFIEDNELQKKFIMIIDEVDLLDHDGSDKKSVAIDLLKYFTLHTYGISATVSDTIVQEDLHPENIKFLKPLPIYKGVEAVTWRILKHPMNKLKYDKTQSYDDRLKAIFKYDPNLKPFLKKFSKWNPVYQEKFDDFHPVMYLLKISHTVDIMKILQDYLKKYNITTIVYNGDGINLWTGKTNDITIDGKEIPFQDDGYHIKRQAISTVIGYLKNEDGGYLQHPRILIIAGKLASRGISFVSNDYGRCIEENKLGWHLIGEYLNCSDTTDQPELIQSARLCGNIIDDIELRWYTSDKISQDIVKSFNLASQILDKALQKSDEHCETLSKAMEKVTVSEKDMIKRRRIAKFKKVEQMITTVSASHHDHTIGDIFIILQDTLAPTSKKYYKYFVEMLDNEDYGLGTGVWITKAKVIKAVAKKYKVDTEKMNNTSHPWHDENKDSSAKHSKRTADETASGLLFKQKPGSSIWYVRYNV